MMLKCEGENSDICLALLEQRNTSCQDNGRSPTEMLFGPSTRSTVPQIAKQKDEHRDDKRQSRKGSVKRYYDKTAKSYPPLETHQNVYFELRNNSRWILGEVIQRIDRNTYLLESEYGVPYRRNRLHIRSTKVKAVMRDKSPVRMENSEPTVPNDNYKALSTDEQPDVHNSDSNDTVPVYERSTVSEPSNSGSAPTLPTAILPNDLPIALRKGTRERRQPLKLKDYVP